MDNDIAFEVWSEIEPCIDTNLLARMIWANVEHINIKLDIHRALVDEFQSTNENG